jgi:hypothetical protein
MLIRSHFAAKKIGCHSPTLVTAMTFPPQKQSKIIDGLLIHLLRYCRVLLSIPLPSTGEVR